MSSAHREVMFLISQLAEVGKQINNQVEKALNWVTAEKRSQKKKEAKKKEKIMPDNFLSFVGKT